MLEPGVLSRAPGKKPKLKPASNTLKILLPASNMC